MRIIWRLSEINLSALDPSTKMPEICKESGVHLPFGLPPIFPDLSEQLEAYLTQPERFPIHNSEKAIR